MTTENHEIVFDIWKSHKEYLGKTSAELQKQNIVKLMAGIFCPGPFFYYVIDSPTLTFEIISDTVKDILGIEVADFTIQKYIDSIHPEDMEFFMRCEDVVAYFLKNCVSKEKMLKYKICYSIRVKNVLDGNYRLLLFQTITAKISDDGELLKVFGSQTDIGHIAEKSNKKLSLIGMDGEPSYLEIDVFEENPFENYKPFKRITEKVFLTKREIEIIKFLAKGYTTKKISEDLNISTETVTSHRKNMLKKSGFKNTTELIVYSIRNGII